MGRRTSASIDYRSSRMYNPCIPRCFDYKFATHADSTNVQSNPHQWALASTPTTCPCCLANQTYHRNSRMRRALRHLLLLILPPNRIPRRLFLGTSISIVDSDSSGPRETLPCPPTHHLNTSHGLHVHRVSSYDKHMSYGLRETRPGPPTHHLNASNGLHRVSSYDQRMS